MRFLCAWTVWLSLVVFVLLAADHGVVRVSAAPMNLGEPLDEAASSSRGIFSSLTSGVKRVFKDSESRSSLSLPYSKKLENEVLKNKYEIREISRGNKLPEVITGLKGFPDEGVIPALEDARIKLRIAYNSGRDFDAKIERGLRSQDFDYQRLRFEDIEGLLTQAKAQEELLRSKLSRMPILEQAKKLNTGILFIQQAREGLSTQLTVRKNILQTLADNPKFDTNHNLYYSLEGSTQKRVQKLFDAKPKSTRWPFWRASSS